MWRARKIIGGVLSLVLIGGVLVAVIYQQQISDQFKVWQYQPSAEVAALADRAGLSATGRFYFYVTHPRLETAEQFNQDCRRTEKASPILGCYRQGSDTIHIYNVTDAELDGIKEVTAAHEMLHAAYQRFSEAERQRLSGLLEAAYQRAKTPQFAERMAYYDRAQPGSRHNELHSIIGTEVADIGPELEAHYQRFFSDRQKVVALHAKYHHTFTALETEAGTLQATLASQRQAIERDTAAYETAISQLNQAIAAFNQRAERGDFASQQQFQQERAALATRMRALDEQRVALTERIAQYNTGVERLNKLGERAERLNQKLDSHQEVR